MSALGEPDATISQLRDSLNEIVRQRRHEAEHIVDAGMLELDELLMKELAAKHVISALPLVEIGLISLYPVMDVFHMHADLMRAP